jgi:predicted MFS family arabinose efflux permease
MDPSWIATAFGAVNTIRVLFYLPQIVAVQRSSDGARDIALSTWALWALTNALGAAHGAVVARDTLLAASFALSMLACVVTMALTVLQRQRFAAARRPAMKPARLPSTAAR